MKTKLPSESVAASLDKRFPIIERLQSTPSGWVGMDRLFSRDAVDHAEYVDFTGNTVDEDDKRQWAIIHLAEKMVDNVKYWNSAFSALWDKYGIQILSIIKSGRLTPKQQKVMELILDGHNMVDIQLVMGFKNRSDVSRHFKRAAKHISRLLQKMPRVVQLDDAA